MINNEADKLANEILNLSRNKLLVNLRFMDVALSYHKRIAYEGSLATDGKTLLYDPGFILRTYIRITRDPENPYNPNNSRLFTERGKDVGNMPAELCNAVAPLYDEGKLVINRATVSFVDPISKRSRHAKQAILFVEMHANLTTSENEV